MLEWRLIGILFIIILLLTIYLFVLYRKINSLKKQNEILDCRFQDISNQLDSIKSDFQSKKIDVDEKPEDKIENLSIPQEKINGEPKQAIIKQKFKGKKILLVDDDDQIRISIRTILSPYFHILEASDVNEALKLSEKESPDLIISDILMPGESGISFCHSMKENRITSHIPIILITGSTSDQVHLQVLSAGADAFIPKPFDKNILLNTINNLLSTLDNIKQRFSFDTQIIPSDFTKNKMDEELLSNAISFIEKNISDPELNGDILCKGIGISKSLLYIKLKKLTGQTINEFIRTIRLKKSTVLLLGGELNIAQISAELGFNSPSYYTKSFTRHFGQSPSEYIEAHRKH